MIDHALKYLKLDVLIKPVTPVGAWFLRVSPSMITCRQFNDFIYDYVDGALLESQVQLFERHIRICPMCRNFLRTYIASHKARGEVFPYDDIDVPDVVPQDLIEAILNVKQNQGE